MKILFLSLLIAITVVIIPNVYAESYEEFKMNAKGINTHHEYFEAFSSWALDNKDILGKDISFYVDNKGQMKADFTVSNISLIPLEKEFHYILSFDTNVKLESQLRYPDEFVMDGRSLTVIDHRSHEHSGGFAHTKCNVTGVEFNSESGDTGTFHSCFGIVGYDEVGNRGAGEVEGVAIYVDYYDTGLQPISVMADIKNMEEKTNSVQQSWFDSILNFFKSLFA